MKLLTYLKVTALVFTLGAVAASATSFRSFGFGENETSITLVIKADGSCLLTNQAVEPRKALERQISAWERYSQMAEGPGSEDEEAASPPAAPPKVEPKSLTNEQLAAKLHEMYQQQSDFNEQTTLQVEPLAAATNSVRVVTSRSFASLKELLSQSPWAWGPSVLMVENARFETTTNGQFQIAFTPPKESQRFTRSMTNEWKRAKMKFAWKVILPGKILSSSLPFTQENITALELDSAKPETLEAGLKLVGSPLVITAEPAGLKLDQPLESKELVRTAMRHADSEPDLPVTDAGPGFVAEPVSITLSTVYLFPEGEKHFKNRPEAAMLAAEPPGLVVAAKLFPPKGRQIRSVTGLHVKLAKDDKGRTIPQPGDAEDAAESYHEYSSSSDDSEKGNAAHIQLRLGLPASDAQTIEALEAEAVALTLGGWKELILTNVQADAKKEIDLSEVLPGAKLIIKKVSAKKPQTTVEARLEGPPAIKQLELSIKMNSRFGGSSNMSGRQTASTKGKATRNLSIQAYDFEGGPGNAGSAGPVTLLVRYPQDVKRERVQFTLSTLDLL